MKIFQIVLIVFAVLFAAVPSNGTDLEKGRVVYEKYCLWCHGKDGAGDGPAAPYLNPPPRDFTYGLYKWKSTPFSEITPSDGDFRKMISGVYGGGHGLNGTAMPGWGKELSKDEIKYVIAYIKSFSGLEEPEEKAIDTGIVSRVSGNGLLSRGQGLFKKNCRPCHGAKGRGDGEKRLKDDFGARTWPRNLTKPWTFRAGARAEDIYTRITTGIQGTQMPSFADPDSRKVLSDKDRAAIARYVTTLAETYKKPGPHRVIRAERVKGRLPKSASDPLWNRVRYRSFALFPQMTRKERHFTPTIDGISVKALYNDKTAVLLLEWDDRTRSVPGDREAEKLAEGKLFRDSLAIEFPLKRGTPGERPSIAMGDGVNPVSILRWQSASKEKAESFSLFRSEGPRQMRPIVKSGHEGISAKGVYSDGTWSLIVRIPLSDKSAGLLRAGKTTPLAFALWDGSNGEHGSRHVLSSWLGLELREKKKRPFTWPLIVFFFVAVGEVLLMRAVGRGEEEGE